MIHLISEISKFNPHLTRTENQERERESVITRSQSEDEAFDNERIEVFDSTNLDPALKTISPEQGPISAPRRLETI